MKVWKALIGLLAALGLWGIATKLWEWRQGKGAAIALPPRPAASAQPAPGVVAVDTAHDAAVREIDAETEAKLVEVKAHAAEVASQPTAADRLNAAFGDS